MADVYQRPGGPTPVDPDVVWRAVLAPIRAAGMGGTDGDLLAQDITDAVMELVGEGDGCG